MKTISELAKDVYNARNNPGMLAELHITLATMYSNMNEEWVEIQLKKADFWQVKDIDRYESYKDEYAGPLENPIKRKPILREKPLSDKQVEMMWIQTDEGKKEIKLKYALRSLEKLMSAVKSSLVNATIEARNI